MSDTIERFQARIAAEPNDELAQFSLGKALFDARRFAEARNHLELAAASKPEWMAAQILLAKCELAVGNRAAARRVLEQAQLLAQQQNHQGPLAETRQLLAMLE